MIYYFDTNILVTAARLDFPFETNQQFWDWLVELGGQDIVRIPEMVYDELGQGDDSLAVWANNNKNVFWAPTLDAVHSLSSVLDEYENPINETTLERIKADPYVVAHAHAKSATVVTYETPNNATAAHKKKIPNICKCLNVPCIRFPQFIWMMKS